MVEDRLQSLKVSDVMTRQVVELSPQQSLREAAQIFVRQGVSSAPVVNADHRCVGVLSAVDYLRQTSSSEDGNHAAVVQDVMTADVRTVSLHDSLLHAAQLMSAKHLHRLPVLGDDQRVVGVISTMDLVAAVLNAIDEANWRLPNRSAEPG